MGADVGNAVTVAERSCSVKEETGAAGPAAAGSGGGWATSAAKVASSSWPVKDPNGCGAVKTRL
jgi:hypothetical protein